MDPFRNSPIPHKQVSEAWRHIDSFKGEEFSVTSRDLDAQFNDFQRNPNESVIGACMRLQTIIQKERLFNRHRDIESIAWKMFDKALPDSSLQWGMLKTTLTLKLNAQAFDDITQIIAEMKIMASGCRIDLNEVPSSENVADEGSPTSHILSATTS
eukprot:scaffold1329_cov266-Prasinococcus_capsulatus_cf.AAC.1